jgi:TPR repeat protein
MIRSTLLPNESPTGRGRNLAGIVSAVLACIVTGLLVYWFWRKVLGVPLVFPGGIHLNDGPTSLRPWAPWWLPITVMVAMTLLVWRALAVRRGTVSWIGAPFAMMTLAPMAVFIGALSLQLGILMQLPDMPPAEKIMQFAAAGLGESTTLFVLNLDFVALVLAPAAVLGLLIAAVARIVDRSGVDSAPITQPKADKSTRTALVAGSVIGLASMIAFGFWVADNSYFSGRGAPRNNAQPAVRHHINASTGNAAAQYNLGLMHAKGLGVERDYAEAVKWFRLAAEQGHASAQFNLGLAYEEGKGVDQDFFEAAKWYRKSADQGHALAQINLGMAYQEGRGVDRNYDNAFNLFRKAADQGQPLAQNNVGAMYSRGWGVTRNVAEAIKWYRLAAEQGNALAQVNLGNHYAKGQGLPQDYAEAARWYQKAAGQGSTVAQDKLKSISANTQGTDAN